MTQRPQARSAPTGVAAPEGDGELPGEAGEAGGPETGEAEPGASLGQLTSPWLSSEALSPSLASTFASRETRGGLLDLPDSDDPHRSRLDPLDPAARHAAQLGPPPMLTSEGAQLAGTGGTTSAPETQARTSLEGLLPELVRKIAWSSDGRRGSMRLELGAGALAGGTLVVHADDGRIKVELDAPGGADVAEWRTKIHDRLVQRGVDVEDVVVR